MKTSFAYNVGDLVEFTTKQATEENISVYKNPKTNQWERPIVANMASGVYNTWEVKSIKV